MRGYCLTFVFMIQNKLTSDIWLHILSALSHETGSQKKHIVSH